MARLLSSLALAAFAVAQTSSGIAGIWSLNRSLSQFPRELGFDADWMPSDADGQPASAAGGGRGRGGRTSATPTAPRRESYEDGQRVRLFTEEVRNPPARLTIVDNAAAVIITNELGQSRTLHPNARAESIEIQGVPVTVTTGRDGSRLIVTYHVEQDRDVRYTYSPSASPARLTVDAQFLDHGKGDKVTRVYDAGLADVARASQPSQSAPPGEGASQARETFDQRPGAEFRGLKNVGVLVEDLGPEAIACGLKRDTLEDALARRLSAGGLSVRKNSDEDTYVYVNIITTSTPTGSCVSRYDAFLYTHATAKLAYHDQPVLVQVSLTHRGGIGTSAAAAHPAAVTRGLENYIDVFLTQIRDANK